MTNSHKAFEWSSRLLPFLILVGLLVPGDAWIAQEIRTFAGLITVLILPGYALARGLGLFNHFDSWLDALSLSVALTWSIGLLLWLAFFFLNVPLQIVSYVWLGTTLVGLIAASFVPLPNHLTSWPSRPWLTGGIALWIIIVTGIVFLYGGRVDGDAYSYMTWLRNIRAGDIRPGVNIHASWEQNYPFFKNLYAPTYLYYAMTSFLGRVDTNWVWTHAPTMWMSVMLAVQFSLTRQIFKRKVKGYVLVFLLPLIYAGRPLFTSIGDSHHICNVVLLPMAFWLFLRAIFAEHKALWWAFPIAVLTAISLTFEHLPHIVHYLLVVGTFTLFYVLSPRRRAFWRSVILILVVLLLVAPFIWHTLQLASAYGFDAQQSTATNLNMSERGRAERFLKLGGERFFIVIPRKLLAAGILPELTILGIVFIVLHLKTLWRNESARLLIGSTAIVFFIGLNPVLTPLLSRLVAPHVTHRLNEALIIYPALAYGVTRTALQLRISWRHRRQLRYGLSVLAVIFLALVSYNLSQEAMDAVKMKARGVIYSPAGVSTNLSDRLIRRMMEKELESPPYPILDPPAQLTRYLDAATLRYIREQIPSDSVFLSERLTEYNLPAYADQLAYLGRQGWPEWGDICPRVRDEGARAAFPTVRRPEVYHRLDVACAILDSDADPEDVESLLRENSAEIDYLLVTPNTSYLRDSLDRVMPEAQVYDNGHFAIYAVESLR